MRALARIIRVAPAGGVSAHEFDAKVLKAVRLMVFFA